MILRSIKILLVLFMISGLAACGSPDVSELSGDIATQQDGESLNREYAVPLGCTISRRSPICPMGSVFFREALLYLTAAAVESPYELPEQETVMNSCIKFSEIYTYESCYHDQIDFDLIYDSRGKADLCIEVNSSQPRISTPIFYDLSHPSGSDLDLPGIALPEADRVVSEISAARCPYGYRLNASTGKCERRSRCELDSAVAAE